MPLPALLLGAAARFGGRAATANVFANAGHMFGGSAASQTGAAAATKKAADASKGLTTQLRLMNAQMLMAGQRASGIGASLLHHLITPMTKGLDVIKSMAEPVQELVALANPARANQFMLAMTDAYAVVGRQLIPVMISFTNVARKVGDFLAGMEPVMQPLMQVIADFIDRTFTKMLEVAKQNAPAIETMVDAMVMMVEAAIWAADQLLNAVDRITAGQRWIMRQAGLLPTTSRADFSRTGLGAAARESRFVGAKEISDTAIKNALSLGATGKAQRTQEQILGDIDKKLGEFFGWAKREGNNGEPEITEPFDLAMAPWRRLMTG